MAGPEDDDRDDYDRFLDTWEPSELLHHSSLEQNLNDPYSRARLFEDSSGTADVKRTPFLDGIKQMVDDELVARRCDFFVEHQSKWSSGFRDQLIHLGVPRKKVSTFIKAMATLWVGGVANRQKSGLMLGIKASIRNLDRLNFPRTAGKFTLNPVADRVEPFFTPTEMQAVFDANSGLIEAYLPDYVDALDGEGPEGVSGLYVRRGVKIPYEPQMRLERYELSSYSLGIGTVEQFARIFTSKTKASGIAAIFSAPLPAVQTRIVAFAPFISKMTLGQLELVVAPPVSETPLTYQGEFDGIKEYLFE